MVSSSAAKLAGHLLIGAALGGVFSGVVAGLVDVPYDPTSKTVVGAWIIVGTAVSAYFAGDMG